MKALNQKDESLMSLESQLSKGLDPNTLLRRYALEGDLEKVHLLFEYGADIETLFNPSNKDLFLDQCIPPMESYLNHYRSSSTENPLVWCLDEIASVVFRRRYAGQLNRGPSYTYHKEFHSHRWSIGLIKIEWASTDFRDLILKTLDLTSWDERFQSFNPLEREGYLLVATISKSPDSKPNLENIYETHDPLEVSPNICSTLQLQLVEASKLDTVLSEVLFYDSETILGLTHLDAPKVFLTTGEIQAEILDQMKKVVSHYSFQGSKHD